MNLKILQKNKFCDKIFYIYNLIVRKLILLSTSSLDWYGLHRIFLFAKEAWFYGVDLSVSFENFDTLDADYIKKISDETWVKVLSISAPSAKITESIVDKLFYLSSLLWSQVITFCPPHFSDKNDSWYKNYLPKIKKSSNISISVQNVIPEFLFFIIPTRRNASLIEIKKITGDTSFDLWNSNDIIKDSTFLWNSIKNIYINDSFWENKWLLLWTAIWWTSNLPIESFFMKMKANWYNWFFSLKVSPKELWVWNEEKVLINLKNSISYYEKYFVEK